MDGTRDRVWREVNEYVSAKDDGDMHKRLDVLIVDQIGAGPRDPAVQLGADLFASLGRRKVFLPQWASKTSERSLAE